MAAAALVVGAVGCGDDDAISDAALRDAIETAGVRALGDPPVADAAKAALGARLFGDVNLSGNRDIACATCHVPELATTDLVSLAIGTGGRGVGPNRVLPPARRLVARNTLDLFNRGYPEWTELGWDGQVRPRGDGGWTEPEDWEDTQLPDGLDGPLAAMAIVALSDRDQMTGRRGDTDVNGAPNELGGLEDEELPELWRRLAARIADDPSYDAARAAAYPDDDAFGIVELANALSAYVSTRFVSAGSPFDAYLAGDDGALDGAARRGAALFFGRAGCADCHNGPHLSDHAYHNVGTPQVGLGQEDEEPLDYGRGRETNATADRFLYRTPPLRNTALTGPWMHDGAYTTLEAAVRHHLDCEGALRAYDRLQLKPELQFSFRDAPIQLQRMLATLDPWCDTQRALGDGDVNDLLAFLNALTSPDAEAP